MFAREYLCSLCLQEKDKDSESAGIESLLSITTVNSLLENSPCSYQMCGTSAQCTYWPLDPALEAQRTA